MSKIQLNGLSIIIQIFESNAMDEDQIHIRQQDFAAIFQDNLSKFVKTKIKNFDFLARRVSVQDRDKILLKIMKTLLDPKLAKAGKHRQDQWEEGWAENLKLYLKHGEEMIIPRYFGKYDIIRWRQQFLHPVSANFEYNMLAVIQYWLFDKYLRSSNSIYEFGCGTGHNLLRVREVNPEASLWGLDWARSSQEIIQKIRLEKSDPKLNALNFDFLNPDTNFKLNEKSTIYTVAALEQIGRNYQPFIDYLLENKPEICIHIEPIAELLDPNNLVDFLSVEYFKKRNYLDGYLLKLQELEKRGKIKMHRAQRSFIGSLYIEGYSIIVWSPI